MPAEMKENLTEMTMTSSTPNRRVPRLVTLRRVGSVVALVCLLLLAIAASAMADPQWSITSVHGPANMPPGGTGQYILQAFNIGDLDSAGDVTITDTLPAGVTATGATGFDWDCSATTFPASTVTCTNPDSVIAPSADAQFRGAGAQLTLTVSVDGGLEGTTADNAVTITGGSAPSDASATDPTLFSSTPSGFGFALGSFLADVFDVAGSPARQAGSHPYEARFNFTSNLVLKTDPDLSLTYSEPAGDIKTLMTRLPRGLIGDPEAAPQCPGDRLNQGGPQGKGFCPANTQVGTIDLVLQNGSGLVGIDATTDLPVYNMVPPPDAVAAFAFAYLGNPVWVFASLDPSDYSVVAKIVDANQIFSVRSAQLTMWGVPADPAHDPLRMNPDDGSTPMGFPSNAPLAPFLTLPSQCGVDDAARMQIDSWQNPGTFVEAEAPTAQMTGCDDPRFRFDASISVQPQARTPYVPTGIDVDLSVPQKYDTVTSVNSLYASSGDDRAIATPPLRNATVTLPEGMTVSPSSADGLGACTPQQIGLGTNDKPACPDASKIGSISIETPLLANPLAGNVYLAAQNDNPFGSLLALYLVAEGPGIVVKLPGKVEPDPVTGQLKATFDDNPQLPFTKLHLHFNSGARAPLVTPPTCGVKTTTAEFTSWNASLPTVSASDSFVISGDGNGGACVPRGFDPGFVAGAKSAIAGVDSPLVTRFTRADSDEELSKIDVSLPEGVLGRIAKVDLCSATAGDAGRCGAGSLIGTVTVGAGPGSNPFFITDGKAYITEGYKDAPFGLSMVVHAKAGPFDLGNVIVRAQVLVDKKTATLRVVSDPLPTILQGIPLLVRVVDVTVDRPHFTFNPTNCSELQSSATLTSTGGKTVTKTSRFQVTDCAALPFKPHLTMQVGRKGRTASGKSTPLVTTLTMPKGRGANLAGVKVTLPEALNALLPVITDACTLAEFHAGKCAKARAGTATATTPLLKHSLTGGVFFVKNGRPLPDLMVALRGQVDVDLDGKVDIPASNLLSTKFDTVPDVPITKFVLRLSDGKNGPIGVARNLCSKRSRRETVALVFTAQNGKVVRRHQHLIVNGCAKKKAK